MRMLHDDKDFEYKASGRGTEKCIGETDTHLSVRIGRRVRKIPKKAVHDNSEVYREGDFGKLVVKRWYAKCLGWQLD